MLTIIVDNDKYSHIEEFNKGLGGVTQNNKKTDHWSLNKFLNKKLLKLKLLLLNQIVEELTNIAGTFFTLQTNFLKLN